MHRYGHQPPDIADKSKLSLTRILRCNATELCGKIMKAIWIPMLIAAVSGLSLTERDEISRRFKYYYNTVRPTSHENFITGANGTFFKINVEFNVVATEIKTRSLLIDAVVMYQWTDDRLIFRNLFDEFELPKEFKPWLPRVRTDPEPHTVTVLLSPATGLVSLYHRVKGFVGCSAIEWKYPFETFTCELQTGSAGDEVLTVNKLHDLRPEPQTTQIGAEIAPFPASMLCLRFSSAWNSELLAVFLPSVLIVAVVFFAQWKRRKVQILVSLVAIICVLVLLVSSRPYHSTTLLDLWISGCFIHTVFLLLIDLTLPARRVRYALLVDVEDNEKPKDTILKSRKASRRKVDVVEEWLRRKLGIKSRKDLSQIVLPSESAMLQRQITTTTLGERKRIALIVICMSYLIFALAYTVIVFSLE